MKRTLQIMADFERPELLKNMVEKLVNRSTVTPQKHTTGIDTASTEAYVCGTISLDEDSQHFRMPFDGSFLFTCIRNSQGNFEMAWSSSLS